MLKRKILGLALILTLCISSTTPVFADDFEGGTITPRGEVGGTPLIETPETGGTVDVQYIPGKWLGVLKDRALGKIMKTIMTEVYTIYNNWIISEPLEWGGEDNACSEVKVSGNVFNHKSSANWVGDGLANSSKRVFDIQLALRSAGYNPGTVDGYWGTNTKNAVKSMQSNEGMVVDGNVGPKTWAKIGMNDCAD